MKKLSPNIRNGRFPDREVKILEVSENGKAYSRLWRNGRITFREMTIFNDVSALEKISSQNAKRPSSHSRNDHIRMFSSFGNCILVSGETAGLKFENDHFSDVSAPEKFSPELRNGRVPVREMTIFDVSEQGVGVFSPPAKRPAYRSQNYHTFRRLGTWKNPPEIKTDVYLSLSEQFFTLRIFGKPILYSGETVALSFPKWHASAKRFADACPSHLHIFGCWPKPF